MIYDRTTRVPLRAWLIKTLEPICDAEPGALADYVLALLEHEAPEQELRKEFISQLEEFLEKGASDFVDSLFSALRSKSYVPYLTLTRSLPAIEPTQIDTGIPIPLDALTTPSERGVKRSLEYDEGELQGPLKGPRLSSDELFSRYPQSNGLPVSVGGRDKNGAYGKSDLELSANGRFRSLNERTGPLRYKLISKHDYQETLPKGVCRDYHIKGYCARGALCKYSHDDAAFAPAQFTIPVSMPNPLAVPGGSMAFLPMFSSTIPGNPVLQNIAYDPHEAMMDMRPGSSKIDDQFFPHPHIVSADCGPTPDFQGRSSTTNAHNSHAKSSTVLERANFDGNPNTIVGNASNFKNIDYTEGGHYGNKPKGSDFKTTRLGGREIASHELVVSRPSRLRDNKTLVVEKIPEDYLSLEAVNSWFQRFGTVTNVAVDVLGGKALVSFFTHEEARLAWKAEEAIFNNRFVKIYWHRPLDGQGTAGVRKLQSSAPLVANLAGRESRHPEGVPTSDYKIAKSSLPSSKTVSDSSNENLVLVAKQQQLYRQISEHKELMARLASADTEEKKKIMTRLRQLAEEEKLTGYEFVLSTKTLRAANCDIVKDFEKKEMLNVELDAESNSRPPIELEKEPESHEILQAKLIRLRAEAKALGIHDSPNFQRTYRMHRGRGRLRPYRATRKGGLPRFNMTLDNRPKALQLKGLNARDPDVLNLLKSWYEIDRHMQSIEIIDETSAVIYFVNRTSAEQAFGKGSTLPSIGNVQISWYRMTDSADDSKKVILSEMPKKASPALEERLRSPRPEYITDVSEVGWGDPDEDGMGMF